MSGLFSMNCNSPEEKYLFIMDYFHCKGLVKEKMGSNCTLFNHFGTTSESSSCTYFQKDVMLGHSGCSIANICHMLWLWNFQGNRWAKLIGTTVWMEEIPFSQPFLLCLWWNTSAPCSTPSQCKTTLSWKHHTLHRELPELEWITPGKCYHIEQGILITVSCLFSWNRLASTSVLLPIFNMHKYPGSSKSETLAQPAHCCILLKGIHWM